MPDLRELYQEVILEHSKAPRNYRELATANHRAEGYNPLCGDHFTVYLDLEGDSIRDISFQGSGCAISKASASLMTQSLKGKTKAEAARLFDQFHKLVTGQSGEALAEGQVSGQLDKADQVAALATAVAVEEIFAGVDIERRPSFGMQRTEPDKLGTATGRPTGPVTLSQIIQ